MGGRPRARSGLTARAGRGCSGFRVGRQPPPGEGRGPAGAGAAVPGRRGLVPAGSQRARFPKFRRLRRDRRLCRAAGGPGSLADRAARPPAAGRAVPPRPLTSAGGGRRPLGLPPGPARRHLPLRLPQDPAVSR